VARAGELCVFEYTDGAADTSALSRDALNGLGRSKSARTTAARCEGPRRGRTRRPRPSWTTLRAYMSVSSAIRRAARTKLERDTLLDAGREVAPASSTSFGDCKASEADGRANVEGRWRSEGKMRKR
jgi:hypothetical protein